MQYLQQDLTQPCLYVPYKEAKKWYRLAIEQGHDAAQFNMGVMYANGEGVIKDKILAHMWFNIAASNGHEKGREYRDKIVTTMSPSQIEKAQDLARGCVSNNYKGC